MADRAMTLTQEQKDAVRCDEDLMLTACPGSGKTRVIISKLSRVIDEIRETPRAVACITYTNAAVQEIEARLRLHIQPGDDVYYDICTIHSFCLNNIFRPFCHLIEGYKRGFKVLTPESAEFEQHVTAVCAQYGRHNLTFKDFEDFTQLRVSLDGKPVGGGIDRGALTPAVATAYWHRIRKAGFIDFANIIYYSLLLLRKRPEILRVTSKNTPSARPANQIQTDIHQIAAGSFANLPRFRVLGNPEPLARAADGDGTSRLHAER